MLQKVTRLHSVPTAEETVLTTEVPTKESRLYTLLSLGLYYRIFFCTLYVFLVVFIVFFCPLRVVHVHLL